MSERERQEMRDTITRADRELLTDWFVGVVAASFSEQECTALRRQANKRSLLRWLRGR